MYVQVFIDIKLTTIANLMHDIVCRIKLPENEKLLRSDRHYLNRLWVKVLIRN